MRIFKAKLPLFFELDRLAGEFLGFLEGAIQKAASRRIYLRGAAYGGRMIWTLECGRLTLERIERVAKFPHEHEGTNQNERAQDVPTPERTCTEAIGGAEITNSVAHLVPPDKAEDTQGDGRDKQLHRPIRKSRFAVKGPYVVAHLCEFY